MNPKAKILAVDDNPDVLMAMKLLFRKQAERLDTLSDPKQLITSIRQHNYDVVILDMNFVAGINTGNEGFYWLQEIKNYDESIQVIFLTAYAEIERAVEAVHKGAYDYVEKPWDDEKLKHSVRRAYERRVSGKELKQLKRKQKQISRDQSNFDLVWGTSEAMQSVRNLVEKVAISDANVLILGENGTGKELIAREIHRLSNRNQALFSSVDLGAISNSLFESEMFGHEKGAFTDAKTAKVGKFEMASGGSLFLDEIGNLDLGLQAKLLSVLQSRKVTPVGSSKEIELDIRLISATNANIETLSAEARFREDLLYRINTISIDLPPLRERMEDISELAHFFLKKYAQRYNKAISGISPEAISKLKTYTWPGNIRELQHSIEKAIILCDGAELQPEDFMFRKTASAKLVQSFNLEENERVLIEKALEKTKGNYSEAADMLGINRRTLYNKIKKYDF